MLERLEEAFAERKAVEDRLRRFLADASHELRTPLASIRGYAELFRMGAARDPSRRREGDAPDRGRGRRAWACSSRTCSRSPGSTRSASRCGAPVDLAAIARDAVDDARATAPDRAIELRRRAPARTCSATRTSCARCSRNLLRNALVHTPAGTPIEVDVERDGRRRRSVEVRDHGPGLPAADADALFDRFWRAEGGRERGRAGAGLGLAIVAGIVEAHRGSVRAANARGGGASFTVRLPAVPLVPSARRRYDPALW